MKTLLKLGLTQATWAWLGIILFFILGFGKIHESRQRPYHPKNELEKKAEHGHLLGKAVNNLVG